MQLKNAKIEAEIAKIMADTQHVAIKADLEDEKVEIQAMNASIGAEKARIARSGVDSKYASDMAKIKQGAAQAAKAKPEKQ